MTYEETVEYLFNSTPVFEHVGASAYKEGLTNTHLLDQHFGHPHRRFKTIHIAGTNGKGSCSHTLAAILQCEGYKVGLYTSPHLIDFRERIKVNGLCISEQYVIDFVENERAFFEPLHPSFFELTTAMAFKYFAEQAVDVAIIEVGLGGCLDCTNIISPLLSVITNISFDHTQFLGDTLEAIAHEKAGIIKTDTPVVIGECVPETRKVFDAVAQQQQAPIAYAEDEAEIKDATPLATGGIALQTNNFGLLHCDLGGVYQKKNMNTVLCAAKQLLSLGLIRKKSSIANGMADVCGKTGLMGRWQCLGKHPLVICDTGHNVGGWNELAQQIKAQPHPTKRIVFGMVDDKDIQTVMGLLPQKAHYYFTQATSKRAIPAEKVAAIAQAHQLRGNVYADVPSAYGAALSDASEHDFIFVGGSSYIVADLLTALRQPSGKEVKK